MGYGREREGYRKKYLHARELTLVSLQPQRLIVKIKKIYIYTSVQVEQCP